MDDHEYAKALERVYSDLEGISIDYGVMERTKATVYTIPGNFGWSDVGNWQTLFELKADQKDAHGNILEGLASLINSRDNFIVNQSEKLIALLGAQQLLVVNTPDAVLVADLNRSQEIRAIVEAIKRKDSKD